MHDLEPLEEGRAEGPLATYELHQGGNAKRPCMLSIHPDRLHFTADDWPAEELSRAQAAERIELVSLMFGKVTVLLTLANKKKKFLTPTGDALSALKDWLGPPSREQLRATLKRRLGWTVQLGAVLMLLSLPLLDGMPSDPVLCVIGGLMFATGMLARWVPHRVFFLLGALYFSACVAQLFARMLAGQQSWWWLILAWFLLMGVNDWIFQFRRFAPPAEELLGSDTGEVS